MGRAPAAAKLTRAVQEAPLEKAELVMALSDTVDGWIKVRTLRNNREGFVPVAYLEEALASPARPPPRPIDPAPKAAVAAPVGAKPKPAPALSTNRPSSSSSYGTPAPGVLVPPVVPASKIETPTRRAAAATTGAAQGEVDYSSQNFGENLALWQERERRFIKGEKEVLPQVQQRVYFYYNRLNQRVGPLSEAQMKQHLEANQITRDTFIMPSVGTEELSVGMVSDYFPEPSATFMTAPLPPASSQMWLFVDDQGATQGPFSHEQMREWFNQGFFNENTRAKLAHRTDVGFTKLGVLFPQGEGAFLTEGNQAAAAAAVFVAVPPALAPMPASSTLVRQTSQNE